jgi:hypothetical protein
MTEAEEQEELVWRRRKDAFAAEGLEIEEAKYLAARMMMRDREQGLDDRRVCFECKHYKAKKCEAIRDKYDKPTSQTRFMLMRCDYFKLKGTK